MDKGEKTGRIIVQDNFKISLKNLRKSNIHITQTYFDNSIELYKSDFPKYGNLQILEGFSVKSLDPTIGQNSANDYIYSAYDESTLKYLALEGNAVFTTHSLIFTGKNDYIPITFLTFYFYTRSKTFSNLYDNFRLTSDIEKESNLNYVSDRNHLLQNWAQKSTILFIDGPLIGGNLSSYTLALVEALHKKDIIPIFIVKNTDSNLITEYVPNLKGKFNSDLHWSYNLLHPGQRTNFFAYVDKVNPKNAKIFCYLKSFDKSPQRIEFHIDTFKKFRDEIENIMNLIYYLYLVQGDKKNPQIRPIVIAEKYAREVLKLSNSQYLIKASGLIPTMNEERFGR